MLGNDVQVGLGTLGQLRAELGAEGRAHSAVHQRLQRAEVVHHPPLLLPVRREQQRPKGLQLGTTNGHSSQHTRNPPLGEFVAKDRSLFLERE